MNPLSTTTHQEKSNNEYQNQKQNTNPNDIVSSSSNAAATSSSTSSSSSNQSTELQRMISGQMYKPSDPELTNAMLRCRKLIYQYNNNDGTDNTMRHNILSQIFGTIQKDTCINSPFYYICPITVGSNVMLAANVALYTATHPLQAQARNNSGREYGKPIVIKDDVWIGGNAVILPGVTLHERCVVGAGAVVTKDVPADAIVVGNPAKILRYIDQSSTRDIDDIM